MFEFDGFDLIAERLKRSAGIAARKLALAAAATLVAITGLGFLIAGNYLWLVARFDPYVATWITGGQLLLIALALALGTKLVFRRSSGARRATRETVAASEKDDVSLDLLMDDVARAVRRQPFKSLMVAVAAGIGAGLAPQTRRGVD